MTPLIATLGLGNRLPQGRAPGKALAPAVLIILAAHADWGAVDPEVFILDKTIAAHLGLRPRADGKPRTKQIQIALRLLRESGVISVRKEKVAPDRFKRWIKVHTRGRKMPAIRLPSIGEMVRLRELCNRVRIPPHKVSTLISLALVFQALASERCRGPVRKTTTLQPGLGALRHMLCASAGGSFYRRLAELEAVGVIGRMGKTWRSGFAVKPAWSWYDDRPELRPVAVSSRNAEPAAFEATETVGKQDANMNPLSSLPRVANPRALAGLGAREPGSDRLALMSEAFAAMYG